ncbi:MAG: class I SAM-dependent methyltransferase family protein [Methanomethylovorans sp.]|uniref:class I SAM-dependent methyltransferase n=1 Tax=Methanomethylovorans sp. TaxID=2758717 RepID=UPI003C7539AB
MLQSKTCPAEMNTIGWNMSLRDILKNTLAERELKMLPGRFDVIGGIAVISIPNELHAHKYEIAHKLMAGQGGVKAVVNKTSKLSGEHRVASFELLAGSSTRTVHKEFGFAYEIDLKKVFFNSRLSYERRRIIDMVQKGENVIIPFCGVGPFAIPLAAKGARVIALEKNTEACSLLRNNVFRNSVSGSLSVICSDATYIPSMLKCRFHRAIIPTPYGMDQFLAIVSEVVEPEGMVHFYTFKKEHQIEGLIEDYEKLGLKVLNCRRCGNIAPGVSRWVFDMIKVQRGDHGK